MPTMSGRAEDRRRRLSACLLPVVLLCVFDVAAASAQSGVVTGRITDDRFGQAVQGAAVDVEGTRLTAVADADGRYRIADVPAGARSIVVRHIGYTLARQAVTVPATGQVVADFALQPAPIALDEVVVTGAAGGARLRTIGNSVATIAAVEAQELARTPNFTSLLLARAPGVRIQQTSGRLGAGSTIEVRGSSGALIYVDGVRVNSATGLGAVNGNLGAQGSFVASRLDDIDPEDIESIEIIKGPAAATIYGTEAMAGVIQIITKKGGVNQAPEFTLRSQYGTIFFRDAENRVPTNYMKNAAGEIVAWNAVTQEKERGVPLFRSGRTQSLHGSVSGGTENLRYYASASWDDEKGVEPNNYGNQFSLHTNMDLALSSKVNIASSLNFTEMDNHLGTEDAVSAMLGATCGHILLHPTKRGFCLGYPPEISWDLYDNTAKISRFTASGTASYAMTSWLRHRLLVGIDQTSGDHRFLERFATPVLAAYLTPTQAAGRIGQTVRLNRNITVDYSGAASTNLTSSLASYLSAGVQVIRAQSTVSNLGGQGFPAPGIESVTSVSVPIIPTQQDVLNTTVGMYVQEKFGWNDRLFLTGALRVDNNSAFGEELKWVTYPKADVTWVVSEEPFWKFGKIVNTLRVRGAYGESGRAPNAFQALRTFTPVQGPGGTNGITPGAQGNPNLRPERGKEWEVGFETALLDRLSLDFTYFSKKQVDLIQSEGVAPSSGFPGSIPVNLGRVDASGFEVQAGLDAVRARNVLWRIDANLSTDESWVYSLGDASNNTTDAGEYVRANYPTGAVFTKRVVSADLNPTTGLAINVLCDGGPANNNTPMACAQAPTVYIGQTRPKYSGAISNTVTLGRARRVRLYGLVDFKSDFIRFNFDEALRCTGEAGAKLCDINVNPQNYSPLEVAQTVARSQGLVEMYYQDGSFVKLREVAVSYNVPERFVPVAKRAMVTLAGRELAMWTKYTGYDPETRSQRVLPPLTRFTATLNVGF